MSSRIGLPLKNVKDPGYLGSDRTLVLELPRFQ